MSRTAKLAVTATEQAAPRRRRTSLAKPRQAESSILAQDQAETLGDAAYRRLKDDIITCEFAPGSVISEARLAERYGMTKAPIRRALSILGGERLVEPSARRGYTVAPITLHAVNEIFGLRKILEPAAARMAVEQVDIESLERLDMIVGKGYAPGDRESERRFLSATKRFHLTIAIASGNQLLAAAVKDVLDRMERLFFLGLALRNRSVEVIQENKKIIRCFANRDGAGAERLIAEQIDSDYRMVVDAILTSTLLQNVNISKPNG